MEVKDFYELLEDNGINYYCGVPDSLLKSLCAYITDNSKNHIITANEGNAIGLAAGHYLATKTPAVVYMQNSGLGNAVNPLLSLVDEEVYNIPLLMLIGLRGEVGVPDEPQHVKQGKVTKALLDVMGIKNSILSADFISAKREIIKAVSYMKKTCKPYAFIIKKNTFDKYELKNKKESSYDLSREEAIKTIIEHLTETDIIVSSTGFISRELYELRSMRGESHKQDFLVVGSMGHASSIALGLALSKPNRNVYCLDGDGAFLMHEGALGVIASKKLKNFKHVVFNNEAHDSVGAQPTVSGFMDISEVALGSGYDYAYSVKSADELATTLPTFIASSSTSLLEIKVKCGARANLGRPTSTPISMKLDFMENLNQIEFLYRGALEKLARILEINKAKNIVVFTGKKSFENLAESLKEMFKRTNVYTDHLNVTYYNDFSTNPKKEDLENAINKLGTEFDLIISIGGGSVIDFSKAYKYYTKFNAKIVAIPTTCGTGSEATKFAVIYDNTGKKSLESPSILPDYAVVDSKLVEKNPKYLKACTSMDAFSQAIESFWSVNAISESKEYAVRSILLCKDNLTKYVNAPDKENSYNMMLASNLSGKAINISKTTSAHALSYSLTIRYGIPHGHAVALFLPYMFDINMKLKELKDLKELITDDPISYFHKLYEEIGLEYDFNKLNITDLNSVIEEVNTERLKNNPKKLTKNFLKNYFSNLT